MLPVFTLAGVQVTEIEVTDEEVEGGAIELPEGATTTVAEPARPGCCVLVAVTITVPAVVGVVKTPVGEMEPALADQVTAEL